MARAYVGIGANLGDPAGQVRDAAAALGRLPGTSLAACSSLYRTAPVGYADQPEFINAVAALDTALAPDALLTELQALESSAGRSRSFANAPRTLDLDVLLYDDLQVETDTLTLPHPRMHERAFVLAPLVEIAPEVRIPGRGAARDWLARAAGQRVEALGR